MNIEKVHKNQIELSIVIVNYNVKDFLFDCLKSIENSKTNFNFETIVVDNNSNDFSVEYLKPQFPEVHFIKLESNLGFAKANNIGLEKALGKYILFLNPDTRVDTDTFQVMKDYMDANPEVYISGCKLLNPDGSFQLPCRRGFPTPWAAFSKLFGLQSLFPKSKLFAQYNQTYRSTEETYYIDSVMGAFMFCRADIIKQLKGFEENFFMYGEDLDLCYRATKLGGKVAYVHSTSTIHFKGESTKRSSIDEIKHFYEAMEIFVRKHYSYSRSFLFLLRLGIFIRTIVAYLFKFKNDIPIIIADIVIVNIALLLATPVRFNSFLGFPDYAYPLVFIVLSIVQFSSFFAVGEYFEGEHSIRKVFFGYLVAFFILIGFTYFFKEYAFSRGVLMLTIGIGILLSSIVRLFLHSFLRGQINSIPKVVLLINSGKIQSFFADSKVNNTLKNIELVAIFVLDKIQDPIQNPLIKGNIEYFIKDIKNYDLDEIIIIQDKQYNENVTLLLNNALDLGKKVYVVKNIQDYTISKVVNSVSNNQFIKHSHKLILPRYRFVKRSIDLLVAIFILILLFPFSRSKKIKDTYSKIKSVLAATYSIVGIYPVDNIRNYNSKPGILNLVLFADPNTLNDYTIKKLNDYYENNYSLSLDFDILIKFVFKRR